MISYVHSAIVRDSRVGGVNGSNPIYLATIWVIPVIIAITFHEAAHGFVVYLLGDYTAWRLGLVSFDPVKHIDPFGTISYQASCC